MEIKYCPDCLMEKPISEFYIIKRTGKPRTYCKKCVCVRNLKWQLVNPGKNYGPEGHRRRVKKTKHLRQKDTIPGASLRRTPWTIEDLAVALDRSLTVRQAAKILHRTAYGVSKKRNQ
jgi:hypothetical protein